jgi:hypothetical protein
VELEAKIGEADTKLETRRNGSKKQNENRNQKRQQRQIH